MSSVIQSQAQCLPAAVAETQSQPSSDFWFTPQESESINESSQIWGRLYGKRIRFESRDLDTETFAVGRGDSNNLILSFLDGIPEKILCRISKAHFVISRSNCDLNNPVFIKDLSRNGTFVNYQPLGANNQYILQNDDVISLVDPSYNAFLFKDLNAVQNLNLPMEITTHYYISRVLGTGGFGQVRLVYNRRTCQEFAMKIVKKHTLLRSANSMNDFNNPQRIMNEVKIMKNLKHSCVIRMHDIVDKPDSVYMILEYMQGGDLFQRIISKIRLSENLTKLYFYQICQAIKYLHCNGISHRDIKPENILLQSHSNETLLKLSDFGLSKFIQNDGIMQTLCGTALYVAPEILTTNQRYPAYTNKIDIWSMGVVLFVCLSGTLPFSDDYGTLANEQIVNGSFHFDHSSWKNVSLCAISLIKYMLNVNSIQRPSIDDVLGVNWLRDSKMLRLANKLMGIELSVSAQAHEAADLGQPLSKKPKIANSS